MRLRALLTGAVALCALAAGIVPAAAEAPLVPTRSAHAPTEMLDRDAGRGTILLRFEDDRLHFALVLDRPPVKVERRRLTFEDGRTVDFRWSGRSLWIAGGKYELPFGHVFLVSTRDTVRAEPLEMQAIGGEILLAQLAADAEALAWIEAHGTTGAAPRRGRAEATSEPRHTTEVSEWTWRGLHALTYVVSGAPFLVIVADGPVSQAAVKTSFGGFDQTDLRIGARAGDRVIANRREARFELREGAVLAREETFKYGDGRAFLVYGDRVKQVNAALSLGPPVADALFGHILAMPEVEQHLGLEAAE